jgi:hypothetical protein
MLHPLEFYGQYFLTFMKIFHIFILQVSVKYAFLFP